VRAKCTKDSRKNGKYQEGEIEENGEGGYGVDGIERER
jgi:hypothetical protein